MLWNSLRIGERVVERERARVRLPEQLDHDRHLHGARRVERLVCVDEQLGASVERAKSDGDFGAARGNDPAQLRLEGRRGGRLRGRVSDAAISSVSIVAATVPGSIQRGCPRCPGSCETSVLRYSDTSGCGYFAASSVAAASQLSGSGLVTFSSLMRPFSCAMPRLSRKAAHHRALAFEVIVHERAAATVSGHSAVWRDTSPSSRAAGRSTLFARNFMCAASAATASICCSVDCSSAQNSCAAATRRSDDICFHNFEGRNSLKSCVIRRY